jgi:uncharacterized protein (DUF885 family)
MKNSILLSFLCFASLFTSCKKSDKNEALSTLLANHWEAMKPYNAFSSTSRGETEYNGVFNNDLDLGYIKAVDSISAHYYAELQKIDRETLSETDKISYDLFEKDHLMAIENRKLKLDLMPLHQFWGTHLTMLQYASGQSDQPFKTAKDYSNFLNRVDGYIAWVDTAMVRMRSGMKAGMILPKELNVKLLGQFKDQVVVDPTKSLYFSTITSMPASISAAERAKITAEYTLAIKNKIVPMYQRMSAFLEKEYVPASRKSHGYGALPNGQNIYRYYVKQWTTTNKTPEEIHQLGLSEVARIRSEMEKIKEQVGFKGSLKEFFAYTTSDAKFKIFKTPKDVLDGYHKAHKTMEPKLKTMFNMVPKIPFEIRQTEKFREATASAEYQQGTPDGKRPGIFYAPILDAPNYVYPGMESLFLHEAIPGHHYQVSLQMENAELPEFRKYYWSGAYGEGWALYCESLGKELGLYIDPFQYFGALGDEMHRAIRLVVDTGIHSKGWTRQQAIDYSLNNEPTSLQAAVAEIERYMAIPGQALSYKIGALKIRELRTKYEKTMGAKFQIGEFHDQVLKHGTLPLDILEKSLEQWASTKK